MLVSCRQLFPSFMLFALLLLLSFSSISVDIAKAKGYDETLTNAEITGGGLVKLVSGRDTSILGGNVTGNKVELDVGRNLTVVSPQALGYRKGFTAGLTIGFGPTGISSIGIRGSKEKGDKAWTEPSSIVGVEGVDIRTEDTPRLVGALINATEGDVVLDTGRLELADLNDKDKYKKIGGGITIGISADALTADGINFEYQNKQLEGVTRATIGEGTITIRDMDGDGIENEPEDIEQAEELIAAINRDPELFREITRDTNIDISGDLNLKNLRELPGNLQAIQNYVRAVRAPVPAGVAAQGPEGVEYFRRLIANGLTPQEAIDTLKTPELQKQIGLHRNWNRALAHYGDGAMIPEEVRVAIASGKDITFDENGVPQISINCGISGAGCQLRFSGQNSEQIVQSAQQGIVTALSKIDGLLDGRPVSELSRQELALLRTYQSDLQVNMSYYALCSINPGDLRASGLIPSNGSYAAHLAAAEAFRLGGDRLAVSSAVYRGDGKSMTVAFAVEQLRSMNVQGLGSYLDAAISVAFIDELKLEGLSPANRTAALRQLGAGFATRFVNMAKKYEEAGGYMTSAGRKAITDFQFVTYYNEVIEATAKHKLSEGDLVAINTGAREGIGRQLYPAALLDITLAGAGSAILRSVKGGVPVKGPNRAVANADDLSSIRTRYDLSGANTVAASRTDIPGLEGQTFEGLSPALRRKAGLQSLDELYGANRPIRSPNPNPIASRHAEEDVLNSLTRQIDDAGLSASQLNGRTVNVHISNAGGVCNVCYQGLGNSTATPGVIRQFSDRYPTLNIRITAEGGTVRPGAASIVVRGGQIVD